MLVKNIKERPKDYLGTRLFLNSIYLYIAITCLRL